MCENLKKSYNGLESEVKFLKGVGEKRAKLLARLKIYTIKDVFEHIPRDYIFRKNNKRISELEPGTNASLVGKIVLVNKRKTASNKNQLIVSVSDGYSVINCVWFVFRKWLEEKLRVGETVWICGLVNQFGSNLQILHPEIELLDDNTINSPAQEFWKTRTILPVYSLTEGITVNTMRTIVFYAFQNYWNDIEETVPFNIREGLGFPDRKTALRKLHLPETQDDTQKSVIPLAFEELLYNQLMLSRVKYRRFTGKRGIKFELKKTHTTCLRKSLPFDLTKAQKRVIREIVTDMTSDYQMNRLLQGDVGSGKTIVILFALLIAIENDHQAALLVPTEILAEQHFLTFTRLLSNQPEVKICLLKGGVYKGKKETVSAIAEGKIDIVIGTHALLQKDIVFSRLGLIAIDEQHRFGVLQRRKLSIQNTVPDIINLSATPIPRSLALTVYGDMEISVIDELPASRKRISTYWFSNKQEMKVFSDIREQINEGRQAYIVCPLVEESEKIDLLDAQTLYERLRTDVYPQFEIALLHGKMKNVEKDEIMKRFSEGKIQILVSTTVVEVGIDVANATVMMVQHAERFGLSQMHQLRGRVGRGSDESYCYLITYPPVSSDAKERLNTMLSSNDGFKIAEKDLELRGPGEFFGTIQSGMEIFRYANIVRDQLLLKKAREIALGIVKDDFDFKKEDNSLIHKNYFPYYKEREKLIEF
ncbi:MAG: ATP-dependent DNA helicase RecG [Candidatus Cloacimonetes bacterium]|nr:ATP-dependent DNA helicase RecG [Candidatus Cloacimonadota bacterium]